MNPPGATLVDERTARAGEFGEPSSHRNIFGGHSIENVYQTTGRLY